MSSRLHPVSAQSWCVYVGQHWRIYVWEFIKVCPCHSSSVPHLLFVLLVRFVRWEVGDCSDVSSWSTGPRIYSKQHVILLLSSHLAFYLRVQLVHPYCSPDTATAWKKSRFISIRAIRFPYDYQPVNSRARVSYAYVDITFSRCDIATEICELVN